MQDFLLYLNQNKEWLFSGIGLFAVSNLISFFQGKRIGINITGNKIINNYNYSKNKEIAYDSGVSLTIGASGVHYTAPHDLLLVLKADDCELYIEDILIKTLKQETYSFFINKNERFKLMYRGKVHNITIYPTKKYIDEQMQTLKLSK